MRGPGPKWRAKHCANLYPGRRAAIGPMHSGAAGVRGRPHGVVTWDELWGPFFIKLKESS